MNRMIRLFQVKGNQAFEKYLVIKKKTFDQYIQSQDSITAETKDRLGKTNLDIAQYPSIQDIACAVLKAESDVWMKAAELLRKEELNR